MLSVMIIVLLTLLLPTFVGGSAVQEDLLCTDSYTEFERASVGSNVNGSYLRNQLFEAFYAPNQHLPYSVLVTYQLVLANGTRFNLSSDQNCSTEVWKWLSSPVFLLVDSTTLNRYLLFALNYLLDRKPPNVTITTTVAPCPEKIGVFLGEMTASLQDYALGQIEHKTNLGYIDQGCATFSAAVRVNLTKWYMLIGIFFQILFVWLVSAVLLGTALKVYAQKTFTYSYEVYGMFWGISVTAVVFLVLLCVVYITTTLMHYSNQLKDAGSNATVYIDVPMGALVCSLIVELPVAIYTARKATVAVPCIFKYPAILLCCGRRRAEQLVTTVALWVNLVVLPLTLFHVSIIVLAISAAPFAIITNVMLLVLALSCLANFLSLLFTIFSHCCTPTNQRAHPRSIIIRAVVVLPLLLMIMCFGVVINTMGSVTNVDAKKGNIFSFISSIAVPMLLGILGIFQKRLISAWLKWTPQEAEQASETSCGQEVDAELLDP